MKKEYDKPICDRFFCEEELLKIDSNFGTTGGNTENYNPDNLNGTVENGSDGGGTEIFPDDVGAKGGMIFEDWE